MKHVLPAVFCGVLLSLACGHAGVITSVTCVFNHLAGCDDNGFYLTFAGGGLTLGGSGGESVSGSQYAQYNFCCNFNGSGGDYIDVNAFTSDTETYYTGGPPRTGMAEILFAGFGFDSGPTDATISELGHTLDLSCTPDNRHGCSNSLVIPFAPVSYPFELGVPFQVSMSDQVGALILGIFSAKADSRANLTINLFEADGTTPVAILPTPEPTSIVLVGLGIAVAVLYRRCLAEPKT